MPFEKTGDNLFDLFAFAASRHVPEPNFKIITRKMKGLKSLIYDCKLEVGIRLYNCVNFFSQLIFFY